MSAIALTSAFGLASCSSTEDDGNINPTFDGQSVKTQFAINIPRAAGNNGTRATANQTQGEGKNFLGMEDIVLRPISGTTIGNKIDIPAILNSTDAVDDNGKKSAVKIYSDVEVPIGTQNFLFYGFAQAPEGANGYKFITGSLTKNGQDAATATTAISFTPEKIHEATLDQSENQQAKILAVLKAVMATTGFNNTGENNVAGLYNEFIKLKAGSATSVMQALQRLIDKAGELQNSNPDLQTALETSIKTGEYFDVTDHKVSINASYSASPFPRNLNLPDGIAKLEWKNSEFSYDFNTSTLDGGMTINPQTVIYPAQLSYFANTTIKTSDSEPSSWPTTASAWNNESWNSWSDEVTSSTRAIALKDNINYGVASLKLTVKCNNNSLSDNTQPTPNNISIPTDGFKVTGILVAGQPTTVGYDFQPEASNAFNLTAYDNFSTTPLYATTNASNANYTVLLPSQETTDQDTDNGSVQFALELENGNTEFTGIDGIIPAGARFYLIGKLNPADNKNTSLSPTGTKRIFMSDYQTTANVTISSLKNAYNVIPDIRNTKMQLGLSVDLTWKEGYSFDTTIGGDN